MTATYEIREENHLQTLFVNSNITHKDQQTTLDLDLPFEDTHDGKLTDVPNASAISEIDLPYADRIKAWSNKLFLVGVFLTRWSASYSKREYQRIILITKT